VQDDFRFNEEQVTGEVKVVVGFEQEQLVDVSFSEVLILSEAFWFASKFEDVYGAETLFITCTGLC